MTARSDRIAATTALVGFVPLVEIDLNDRFRAARMSALDIPQLAHANPDWFGICIATRDGFVYGNAATGKSRACGLEIGQEPIGLPTDEGSPYIAHNTCWMAGGTASQPQDSHVQ